MSGSGNDLYPLPLHAASIWLAGDKLMIGLGPMGQGQRGTTMVVPLDRCAVHETTWGTPTADQRGWRALLDTLRARARAADAASQRTIGTEAWPVQYDIDKVLRGMSGGTPKVFDSRGKPKATSLKDLGLED